MSRYRRKLSLKNEEVKMANAKKRQVGATSNTQDFNTDTLAAFSYSGDTLVKYGENGDVDVVMRGRVNSAAQVMMPDGYIDVLIKATTTNGTAAVMLLDAGSFTAARMGKELRRHGLNVLKDSPVFEYIKALTAQVAANSYLTALETVGWNSDCTLFNTGADLICGPAASKADFHLVPITPQYQRMRSQGTLEQWKAKVGVHIEANDIPFVFSCLSLASVLLSWAQQSSGTFNLVGTHGKGKTLALQLAAGIWGNGCDPAHATLHDPAYIHKINSTTNGLEATMGTYGILPAILDELGERDPRSLANECYGLSSGGGKARMTPDRKLAETSRWLLNVLISSEVSIADLIHESGKVQKGGQADRAVDIPLPETGILSDTGSFGDFESLADHLKSATGKFYGTAGRTFVQYCLDNEADVRDHITKHLNALTGNLKPIGSNDGQRRVVQRFALSALVGEIACAAGIFGCDRNRILEAHRHVVRLWWSSRAGSVSRLLELIDSNKVNLVDTQPALHCPPNTVFAHDGLITFQRDFFHTAFPDHKRMLTELAALGLLKTQTNNGGRHYQDYCNRALQGYSFHEKALLEHYNGQPESAEEFEGVDSAMDDDDYFNT